MRNVVVWVLIIWGVLAPNFVMYIGPFGPFGPDAAGCLLAIMASLCVTGICFMAAAQIDAKGRAGK